MNKKKAFLQIAVPLAFYAGAMALLIVVGLTILPRMERGADRTNAALFLILSAVLLSGLFVSLIIRSLQRDRKEESLKDKAQTDSLTGLLNRAAALEQISGFLLGEGREWRHALMIIDLDGFKEINDTFGHMEGDRVLQAMAKKMQSILRPSDIVGRFGGDEFIVLVKYTETLGFIRRHARELVYALEYLCVYEGVPKTVTASIGVSIFDNGDKTFEQLFREADEALYTAKLSGKSRYCIYGDDEQEGKVERPLMRAGQPFGENGALIQLQNLIDNIDGGIALLEIGSEIQAIYQSYSFLRLMNLTSVAFGTAGRRLAAFVHPSDLPVVEATLRAGAQMVDKAVEIVFRRAEGDRILWYHMRASRISSPEGPYPTMLAIVTDVTRLKEAELTYRAHKRQLEMVIQISRIVTFEVDLRTQTIYLSREAAAKYQTDATRVPAARFAEDMAFAMEMNFIHPESKEECRRFIGDILSGKPEGFAILQLLRPDGQYTLERFSYFTVYDLSDRPGKVVVINEALDVSDNSMLRPELIEKEMREFSGNLVSAVIAYPNRDAFRIIKEDPLAGPEEANCQTYTELLNVRARRCLEESQRRQLLESMSVMAMKRAAAERKIMRCEFMVRDDRGAIRWLLMSANVFTDWYRGELVASIRARDITSQKRLCEELGVELWPDQSNAFFDLESLRQLTNKLLERNRALKREKPCALVLLAITNYDAVKEEYGSRLMRKMELAIIGKVSMLIPASGFCSYDNRGHIYFLLPEVESEEAVRKDVERMRKLLTNPSYFQDPPMRHFNYQYEIFVEDANTTDFDSLVREFIVKLDRNFK